ncbi:hypothetical protein AVEN_248941-1, partial [Araneus ventricosus]
MSRFQRKRIPDLKSDYTKDTPCVWIWGALHLMSTIKRRPSGALNFEEGVEGSSVVIFVWFTVT